MKSFNYSYTHHISRVRLNQTEAKKYRWKLVAKLSKSSKVQPEDWAAAVWH